MARRETSNEGHNEGKKLRYVHALRSTAEINVSASNISPVDNGWVRAQDAYASTRIALSSCIMCRKRVGPDSDRVRRQIRGGGGCL